jgi:hypothetical protein
VGGWNRLIITKGYRCRDKNAVCLAALRRSDELIGAGGNPCHVFTIPFVRLAAVISHRSMTRVPNNVGLKLGVTKESANLVGEWFNPQRC